MRGKAKSATLIAGIISSETCRETLAPARGVGKKGNRVRHAVAAVILAVLLTPAPDARAQRMVLADGSNFASPAEYYPGTWKWERPQPRQTSIARFGRDGSFFFHNPTNGVQQFGRYVPGARSFTVSFARDVLREWRALRNPRPTARARLSVRSRRRRLVQGRDERWERQKSSQRPSS
jgi:hypothetical protein